MTQERDSNPPTEWIIRDGEKGFRGRALIYRRDRLGLHTIQIMINVNPKHLGPFTDYTADRDADRKTGYYPLAIVQNALMSPSEKEPEEEIIITAVEKEGRWEIVKFRKDDMEQQAREESRRNLSSKGQFPLS